MIAPPIARAKPSNRRGCAGRGSTVLAKSREAARGAGLELRDPLPHPKQASWDFGKIAVYPASQRILQKRSSAPGADPSEQEADRFADRTFGTFGRRRPTLGAVAAEDAPPPPRNSLEASEALTPSEFPASVWQTLQSSGSSLDQRTQRVMESRLHHDFSGVRIHADAGAARSAAEVSAHAFTVGSHIAFASGRYQPGTAETNHLLAHELVHVVQQGAAGPLAAMPRASTAATPAALGSTPRLARKPANEVQPRVELDQFRAPNGMMHRVGDAAGMRLLMEIGQEGQQVTFRVFNFEEGQTEEVTAQQWSDWVITAVLHGEAATGVSTLGRQLTAAQLRGLWPNPVPELMRRYEAGQISLSDKAVLSTYRGMIRSDARQILDANERQLDELLEEKGRVARIQEYTDGLREASQIRDVLEQRKSEIKHSLVQQHSFTFGLPHAGTGADTFQRMRLIQERDEVEETIRTWKESFPLLTRLRTQDITTESVENRLRAIKGNIIAARRDMASGDLEPMKMDNVRAHLQSQLGPKAATVVAAEDKANARSAMAGAIALTALTIGLLFIPGGVFIDAAIGIAMAASSIQEALILGRAADTSLHVDDGLVSQEAASSAAISAVLGTVFAIMGAAAAGFRVIRLARALVRVGRSMPELALAERAAFARAIARDPKLVTALAAIEKGDVSIGTRVTAALRGSAGNMAALRESLGDIAKIAAIPRRVVASDAYEPIRQIVDGSDIESISKLTGFTRREVAAAKQHLMMDEHILVDDATGALYRGRMTPIESDAKIWMRVAKGERVAAADRQALGQLIRHEVVEAAELAGNQQTLESLFLRGQLETKLRTFLRSKGQSESAIEAMLQNEPKPVTPYRYAHYFAHFTTGPNPGSPAAMRLPLPKGTP